MIADIEAFNDRYPFSTIDPGWERCLAFYAELCLLAWRRGDWAERDRLYALVIEQSRMIPRIELT